MSSRPIEKPVNLVSIDTNGFMTTLNVQACVYPETGDITFYNNGVLFKTRNGEPSVRTNLDGSPAMAYILDDEKTIVACKVMVQEVMKDALHRYAKKLKQDASFQMKMFKEFSKSVENWRTGNDY